MEILDGKTVGLEFEPPPKMSKKQQQKTDRYGRTLAYVRLQDGRDFGLVMVKEGLCPLYEKAKHSRQAEYRAALPKN